MKWTYFSRFQQTEVVLTQRAHKRLNELRESLKGDLIGDLGLHGVLLFLLGLAIAGN